MPPFPCRSPLPQEGSDVALTSQAQLTGAAGRKQKVWKHFQCTFPNPPRRAQCKGGISESRLQRGARSPPHLPPPAISQLRSGPCTPSVLLSYQQELPSPQPVCHITEQLNTPLPQPLALLSMFPSTTSDQACARCTYLISPDMGTSQKATPGLI